MTYSASGGTATRKRGNWLIHHQDYAGHRFSKLDQINSSNVQNLRMMFAVGLADFKMAGNMRSATWKVAIVEDGMMYVTDGWGSVYKIDVYERPRGYLRSGRWILARIALGPAMLLAAA